MVRFILVAGLRRFILSLVRVTLSNGRPSVKRLFGWRKLMIFAEIRVTAAGGNRWSASEVGHFHTGFLVTSGVGPGEVRWTSGRGPPRGFVIYQVRFGGYVTGVC